MLVFVVCRSSLFGVVGVCCVGALLFLVCCCLLALFVVVCRSLRVD